MMRWLEGIWESTTNVPDAKETVPHYGKGREFYAADERLDTSVFVGALPIGRLIALVKLTVGEAFRRLR
jgi:hypothetical protein